MKTFTKLLFAGGAALLLTACQSVAAPDDYKFERVAGTGPLSVRLVRADETPVAGAKLFLERRGFTGPKSQNLVQEVPLSVAGDGTFEIDGDHAGERLNLAAHLPDGSVIHGHINVP
ncbi:MAG: hypothetical protein ISP45_00300 [Reyranella sp.]|nr:hypothetical protein [Reyranella sp.]